MDAVLTAVRGRFRRPHAASRTHRRRLPSAVCRVWGAAHRDLILRGVSAEKKVALDQSSVAGCLDIAKAKLRDYTYCEGCLSGPRASLRLEKCACRQG